ncbi:hypothetical protein [Rhodococcoides yunnanense]|uniref:hypothetical protein n=1 Tax=Rhodococcoides yunnanense TaxID=278209 RepID=UPI000934EF31|nr:hypothetical protein [Rhodococcus yunnanensis]
MSEPENPTTYWQSLAQAADQGHLFLNSEAAAACSRACDTYIDKLIAHQDAAKLLTTANGLGEFESGKALREIFSAKAAGGPNNLVDVLQSRIDVVRKMQVVFDKFFETTVADDQENAAAIGQNGPN